MKKFLRFVSYLTMPYFVMLMVMEIGIVILSFEVTLGWFVLSLMIFLIGDIYLLAMAYQKIPKHLDLFILSIISLTAYLPASLWLANKIEQLPAIFFGILTFCAFAAIGTKIVAIFKRQYVLWLYHGS
jgi:hypothetical protein